eukprot:gnl/Trimastix_PCT/1178.p1 GENE.gnl/Trimastix_PCT/1178~~gnl/Trimastix_PCT/1178.p1  ORF type:complete len:132 (+),score=3.54 gnl/Trimastix_PCT/1178:69-464(+)
MDDYASTAEPVEVPENTYVMEPTENERFNPEAVKKVVDNILQSSLESQTYDPSTAPHICREICQEINRRIRELGYVRYKCVSQVSIGETRDQGVHLASRCLWDSTLDSSVSCSFKNNSLFCVAMVFGCYYE